MVETVLASKLANAFFAEARVDRAALQRINQGGELLGVDGVEVGSSAALAAVERMAARLGGLWVGGRVTLTPQVLRFAPNAMNRFVHEQGDALTLELAVSDIHDAMWTPGFFTGVLEVLAGTVAIRFRIYGGARFLQLLQDARTQAGRDVGRAR